MPRIPLKITANHEIVSVKVFSYMSKLQTLITQKAFTVIKYLNH